MFAWAVTKALDLETMGWYARMLDIHLNMEMDLHRKYAGRFGISLGGLEAVGVWRPAGASTAFLVRSFADGVLADLPAPPFPSAGGLPFDGLILLKAVHAHAAE